MASELPSFNARHLAAQLTCMSAAELDALPFGVIEMDHHFKVLRYNAAESRHSKLPSDRVIGQYFRDVAPWANSRRIARRYDVDALDETIQYIALLQMREEPVTLRMLKPAYNERMYLLLDWS